MNIPDTPYEDIIDNAVGSGALQVYWGSKYYYATQNTQSFTTNLHGFYFDASLSNSCYATNAKVAPSSLSVLHVIKY